MASANCTIVGQCYNGDANSAYGTSSVYAGFNYNAQYYTYRLKFTTPEFVGKPQKLIFNLAWERPNVNGNKASDFSLRYAILTTDNQISKYKGTKNEVADTTDRLVAGIVNITGIDKAGAISAFEILVTEISPSTTYYLYLWGDGSTGKSQMYTTVRPISEHGDVVIEYSTKSVIKVKHYLMNASGSVSEWSESESAVDTGTLFSPTLISPPTTNRSNGAIMFAYGENGKVESGAVVGFTVDTDTTAEIYYPLASGTVTVNIDGAPRLCEVNYKT